MKWACYGLRFTIQNTSAFSEEETPKSWFISITIQSIFSSLWFRKDIAPAALWGNPPLFDLAENLTQCKQYHREQLCNWSKVGRSLGLTCEGQMVSLPLCTSGMRVRERNPSEGPFSFSRLFNHGAGLAYLTSVESNWGGFPHRAGAGAIYFFIFTEPS
jgi:hypothetical protein